MKTTTINSKKLTKSDDILVDYYWLFGLVMIWTASWILMMPFQIQKSTLLFDNVWGAILYAFGIKKKVSLTLQQSPDFLCGFISLLFIIILHLRGLFSVTIKVPETHHKLKIVLLNILSIIVHTLFFTVILKIFLFPQIGNSSFISLIQKNFATAIFVSCGITGIILGTMGISKILLLVFICVSIFSNVNKVSEILGIYGFFGIILIGTGFYLEFYAQGFNKKRFLIEAKMYSGKYSEVYELIKEEILIELNDKKRSAENKEIKEAVEPSKKIYRKKTKFQKSRFYKFWKKLFLKIEKSQRNFQNNLKINQRTILNITLTLLFLLGPFIVLFKFATLN